MNIVFMGTAQFALPFLNKIIESGYNVTGVVTQPDRPRGRGNKMVPTPVKEFALSLNLPIFQPDRIKAPEAITTVSMWEPDLIIVVAYGQIIPIGLLELPPGGCVNVHPSLLPRYRGPAPMQRSIMAGDTVTGITTMFMDKGMDTGDIIMQTEVHLDDTMNYAQVQEVMADKGSSLLIETIKKIESGTVERTKQNDELATYAPMLSREDEQIEWSVPAQTIVNHIRALSPSPGTFSTLNGVRFKIFTARVTENESIGQPGQVREISQEGFIIQTGCGTVELLEVQKEGKKRMTCRNFLKGFKVVPGDILGT